MSNIAPINSDEAQLPTKYPTEQLSAYFLELEGLLARIDAAATYYQILCVDRTVGQEQIKSAFECLVNQLYPPYAIGRTIPAEISSRIDRAFTKTSHAFAVLASFTKRKDYDLALMSILTRTAVSDQSRNKTSRVEKSAVLEQNEPAPQASPSRGDQVNLKRVLHHKEVFSETTRAKPGDNRRRVERFKLSIPVRVTGCDRRGKWNEMAETIDVGRTGIKIRLRRRVSPGTVLYVTLPLPAKLRSHGFAESSYNVYTLIQRVDPPKQGSRLVGLEFIGERPPAGFLATPWASFRRKRSGRKECRRPAREQIAEEVTVEYFDESMRAISKDEARTENVSSQGLRIMGTSAPAEFDLMRVSCQSLNFESMAALRNRYTGKDGLERVCVEFIDKEWPVQNTSIN
ncbi:MAG TPA: DnaJ domain-containing protein [Blastocatellia bacterium]|nr:DnaJ domain-containing protein [Blastocatellia bacterium]